MPLPYLIMKEKTFNKLWVPWWIFNLLILAHFIFSQEINRWILVPIMIQVFLLFIYQSIKRNLKTDSAYAKGWVRGKFGEPY